MVDKQPDKAPAPDKRAELVRALGTDRAQPERRHAIRRAKWIIAAVCVTIGLGLVFFTASVVRNQPVDACRDLLGPPSELEQLVGMKLRVDEGVGGQRDCDLGVWDAASPADWHSGDAVLDRSAEAIVVITNRHTSHLPEIQAELTRAGYGDGKPLALPGGEGAFYEALGAPKQHVILFQRGDRLTRLRLAKSVFTPDRAKRFAELVVTRPVR